MTSNDKMTNHFNLAGADLPEASRATDEALRFIGEFLAAKSAKDVEATMRFFSRDMVAYADGTLGFVFPGRDAMRAAYTAMMPGWGNGQSYPLMVWGDITDGTGSALVYLVDTPEMFGGEAQIFAAVDVRQGGIVRWVDYWDSFAFNDMTYNNMRQADVPFPTDFGERSVPSTAAATLEKTSQVLHAALSQGTANDLENLLHPDVLFENVALGTSRRGMAAVVAYLDPATSVLPFGHGSSLQHVVGGERGGGFEWRAANGRPGIMGVSIDRAGKVLRLLAAYDHRAFPQNAPA